MAAPTGVWEFAYDLYGTRTPQVVTLEASANLETLEGTLLIMAGGQVDEATASAVNIVGLALEKTSGPLTAGSPIKVALIAPGMVIKGKASADASAGSGFAVKTYDVTTQGLLDAADNANGVLAIHRTEDSGITVWVTPAKTAFLG